MTQSGITYVVQYLIQYMHQPKQSHFDVALNVVKYIKNDLGAGILLYSSNNLEHKAFCDLDSGMCVETRRSINGFFIMLGDSLVSWKVRKWPTISRSSAKAKYRSMTYTASKLVLGFLVY